MNVCLLSEPASLMTTCAIRKNTKGAQNDPANRLHIAPDSTSQDPLVDRFFAVDVELFKRRLGDIESELAASAEPLRQDTFHNRLLRAFEESQTACARFEAACSDRSLLNYTQERFRHETAPWFDQSWIANRARTKPSGFAGDYEMLRKLYAQATPARGIGGYLDLCILDLPLARAVRARLASAREFLLDELAARSGAVRVLDIACGPCQEFQDWPVFKDQRLEIVAMDSDPNALAYLEQTFGLQINSHTSFHPVRYNAIRTRSATATVKKFGRFDILYSVGLCDYLPDEQLVSMLAAWRATLKDNGVLYVAFKDTERYDQTPYQWHLDWFFYQRTKQDVLGLFDQAGFDLQRNEDYTRWQQESSLTSSTELRLADVSTRRICRNRFMSVAVRCMPTFSSRSRGCCAAAGTAGGKSSRGVQD